MMRVYCERLIAGVQVGAGVLGAFLFLFQLLPRFLPETGPLWTFLLPALVPVLNVLGGVLLWRGHRMGRPLSLAAQGLQLLAVSIGGVVFEIISGPYLALQFAPGGTVGFHIGAKVNVLLFLGVPELRTAVSVNLVAAAALVYLLRGRRATAPRAGARAASHQAAAA